MPAVVFFGWLVGKYTKELRHYIYGKKEGEDDDGKINGQEIDNYVNDEDLENKLNDEELGLLRLDNFAWDCGPAIVMWSQQKYNDDVPIITKKDLNNAIKFMEKLGYYNPPRSYVFIAE